MFVAGRGATGGVMHQKPVSPWADFLANPELSGMILKYIRPEGKRPIWGEVISARVLASGEVEFTLAWISAHDPSETRAVRRPAEKPVKFNPQFTGPFYYPKGASFQMPDTRSGLKHVLYPPLDSRKATTYRRLKQGANEEDS